MKTLTHAQIRALSWLHDEGQDDVESLVRAEGPLSPPSPRVVERLIEHGWLLPAEGVGSKPRLTEQALQRVLSRRALYANTLAAMNAHHREVEERDWRRSRPKGGALLKAAQALKACAHERAASVEDVLICSECGATRRGAENWCSPTYVATIIDAARRPISETWEPRTELELLQELEREHEDWELSELEEAIDQREADAADFAR